MKDTNLIISMGFSDDHQWVKIINNLGAAA